MKRVIPVLIVMALLAFSSGCRKDSDANKTDLSKFTYLCEEYPPFNYTDNGVLHGVSVDILEGVLTRLDAGVDRNSFQVGNWAEAYDKVLSTPGTLLFSTVRTAQRESLFKWAGPIAPHTDVAVYLKGSSVSLRDVTDLNNYFTGAIEGYSSIGTLLDKGIHRANIILYKDLKELYEALVIHHEVQCIAYSLTGHGLVIQSLGYGPSLFAAPFTIQTQDLWYAFNIETDNTLIAKFQDELDLMKTEKATDGSSEYEKILNRYSVIQDGDDGLTPEMVINLVTRTASDLEADAPGTLSKINQGFAPYKDAANPGLYAFVYDTTVRMVAHADNPSLVGKSFAGKPDATGKLFRDEIVSGALAHGTGWVDYVYTRPDQSGLYLKTTYYHKVVASNGATFVVCAGRYK